MKLNDYVKGIDGSLFDVMAMIEEAYSDLLEEYFEVV